MIPSPVLKFRPSLTLAEIYTILDALKGFSGKQSASVVRKLEVFTLKAQHGITTPSHATVGRPSLEMSLGFETDDTLQQLLQLYQSSPKLLSPTQLTRIQHYRYLNDLMTPEEEKEYEQSNHP